MSHPLTSPMPLRTKVFAAALKAIAREPEGPEQMAALRAKRARLLSTRVGRFITGSENPTVAVTQSEHSIGGVDLVVRVHRPTGVEGLVPIVVNYHGGGWCLGNPQQSAWVASNLAARAGVVVVSPSYRLAPENPYPAAVEDAWAALNWIVDNADQWSGDPSRVVVMGDSAGANLAAVVALMARDQAGPGLAGQVLTYPAVEMYEHYPSRAENADAPLLTATMMDRFAQLYLADKFGVVDWQASPIRATSHQGLPPAFILTAGHDPLRDHGPKYAEVLSAAGVQVELANHPSAIHGFMSLPGVVPAAADGLSQIEEFVRRCVSRLDD